MIMCILTTDQPLGTRWSTYLLRCVSQVNCALTSSNKQKCVHVPGIFEKNTYGANLPLSFFLLFIEWVMNKAI